MAEYYRVGKNGQIYRIFAKDWAQADRYFDATYPGLVGDSGDLRRMRLPPGVKVYPAPPHDPFSLGAAASVRSPAPDVAAGRGGDFAVPTTRSPVTRAIDGFDYEVGRSYAAYIGRAAARAAALDTNFQWDLERKRAAAAGRPLPPFAQIKAAADRRVTQGENERRDLENRRDAADPAWRKGGSLLGNLGRSASSFLGHTAGHVLSNPTMLAGGVLRHLGLSAAARFGLARLERDEGIREVSYPPPPPAPPRPTARAQPTGRRITFGQGQADAGVVYVNGRLGRLPDRVNETVAFETILPPELYQRSRWVHNHRSNEALERELLSNPKVAAYLRSMIPQAEAAVARRGGRLVPKNWVWHHALETGRMELIPTWQHQDPVYRRILHPDGRGGNTRWGAGNRRRRR